MRAWSKLIENEVLLRWEQLSAARVVDRAARHDGRQTTMDIDIRSAGQEC